MKLRKTLAAAGALAIAGGMLSIKPATAANDSTAATFSLTAGLLSIATPATDAATGVVTDLAVTLELDQTTVSDETGSLLGWDVSVNATKLVGANTGNTIACTNLAWLTKNLSATSNSVLTSVSALGGAAVFVDDTSTATPTDDCYTGLTPVVTAGLGGGGGDFTYLADVTLTVPVNTEADDYVTTLTQTVG